MYCEKDFPLFDCATRVQRKNKTAQLITGYVLFKQEYISDISTTFHLSTQDHGIWKQLTQKTMSNTCELYFGSDAKGSDQRKRFLPTIPDGCPVKIGNYSVGPAFVNRYRKDWEKDLQFFIPSMLPEADNWKLVGKFFHNDNNEKVLGQFTIEFRLFNEFMSQ